MPNKSDETVQLKNQLNSLKDKKGLISRTIGEKKRASQDAEVELASMREISLKITSLNHQLKALRKKDESRDEPAIIPPFPGHFCDSSEPPHNSYSIDTLRIREANASDSIAWDQYAETHARGGLYHRYAFKPIIEMSFKHKAHYLICVNPTGKIVGLMPLVHTKSKLFGNYLTSIPYFNYSGPISDHPSIDTLLIAHAQKAMCAQSASHIEIRDTQPREDLPVKLDKSSLVLALPDKKETLWAAIGTKVRAQIKKGLSNEFEFRTGGESLLDDFYHVYSINMRSLGTPVYGKSFFRNIIRHSDVKPTIAILYHQGHAVSCGFLMGYKCTLEIPWASTLRQANSLNANMVLYWNILSYAIANGYQFFDFGRSSSDAGTYRFKLQWGAKPTQLYWHYCLQANEALPQLNPNNPKYRLAINVWKKLPLSITTTLGPMLAKNLP
ncbi:MAG: FemAB family PEP-CTERM system-associated protein [Gammaproteobacteria bacterium]|nr:FemAB family PEP-CTERM system-associated protein [Gammaproteobacteria bacterium]